MKRMVTYIAPGLLLLMALLVGCGQPKITVASKLDTEGAILSQLIIQALSAANFTVTDKTWMASTDDLRSALRNGDIDIYPEYTGNGAKFFEIEEEPNTGKIRWKDPANWSLKWWDWDGGYTEVNRLEKENRTGVEWLQPAPADNSWAIAVNKIVADKIMDMQQFRNYVEDPKRVQPIVIVGSEEFFTSPMALPLFEEKYDFSLKEETGDHKIIVSSSSYAEQLVAASTFFSDNYMYAAMAYITDNSSLEELNLVLLKDVPLKDDVPRAQPWYRPAPVIRSKILKRYPNIKVILNRLFEKLDPDTLNQLNSEAGYTGGKLPRDVAREYLEKREDLKEVGVVFEERPEFDRLRDDRPNPLFFAPNTTANESVLEIINTKITVEPQTLWQTDFYVDGRFMDNVRIVGWMMASGGAFNDVKILVLNDIDFTNWKNFHDIKGVYQSDKVTKAQIEEEIKEPGSYHLVISNRFSEFSSKDVLLKVYLYYQ